MSQIQEQITSKAEELTNKLHLESYRPTSKSDINELSGQISDLVDIVKKLKSKVDKIDKKMSKS